MGAPEQLRREGELAGVEARHPLLDVDLLEAVLRLPPLLAFDPVLDRRLARESMRGALPEPVRTYEGKVFFNALLASALEGVDRGALEALLGDARAEVRAYATAEGIRDLLAERPGRPFDLWRLVTLECWLRTESDPRFIDRAFYRLEPRATSP